MNPETGCCPHSTERHRSREAMETGTFELRALSLKRGLDPLWPSYQAALLKGSAEQREQVWKNTRVWRPWKEGCV